MAGSEIGHKKSLLSNFRRNIFHTQHPPPLVDLYHNILCLQSEVMRGLCKYGAKKNGGKPFHCHGETEAPCLISSLSLFSLAVVFVTTQFCVNSGSILSLQYNCSVYKEFIQVLL